MAGVLAASLLWATPARAQWPSELQPVSYWMCTFYLFYIPISSGVIQTSGLDDPSDVMIGTGTGWGDCVFLAACYPQFDPVTGQITGACN
jgi:hypothetical protein